MGDAQAHGNVGNLGGTPGAVMPNLETPDHVKKAGTDRTNQQGSHETAWPPTITRWWVPKIPGWSGERLGVLGKVGVETGREAQGCPTCG